jgi:polyhydroxybutyrate depolymerase
VRREAQRGRREAGGVAAVTRRRSATCASPRLSGERARGGAVRSNGTSPWVAQAALKTLRLLILACVFVAHAAFAALVPGDYEFSVFHDNLRRSYLVHVPPQAAAGRPLPVVLNFHGAGSNAHVIRTYSRMDENADRHGYIAVYPNGSAGFGTRFLTWNAGKCCGPAAMLQMDDVGFVLEVLDDLAARIRYDRTRVYATGLSNGAMMAYRIAAEASDRIAAVAGVAGTMALPRFAPTRPMPVLHIHSTHDHIARFDGGFGPPSSIADTRIYHAPVETLLERWVEHNACPLKPAAVDAIAGLPGTPDEGHAAIRRVHRPCRGGVEVVLWQLSGPGHVWPGGQRDYLPALAGNATAVIDANDEMWSFFSRFRRAEARAQR